MFVKKRKENEKSDFTYILKRLFDQSFQPGCALIVLYKNNTVLHIRRTQTIRFVTQSHESTAYNDNTSVVQ